MDASAYQRNRDDGLDRASRMSRKRNPEATRRQNRHAAKRPFEIGAAFRKLRAAVRPLPKAAMFQLAEEGFTSVFELLAACIISIRTYDETTLPVARRLFAKARTPADVAKLTPKQIDELIGACTFHAAKARQLHAIARRAV